MTQFWKAWMTAWCGVVLLFGLMLSGGAFAATEGPLRLFLGVLDGPGDYLADPHHRFAFGLMGAVSLGWGLTFYAAFQAAHALEGAVAAKAWRGITVALAVWFVMDSLLSFETGFARNVISNIVLLAAYLLPVLRAGVLKG